MATAADILGSRRKLEVPVQWAHHYQRLCAEREKLMSLDLESHCVGNAKIDDLTDAASEESQRSIILVAASATQATIIEVNEALSRIERGTYGICEVTGQPIEKERLEAIPWARCSMQGQSEIERNGNGRRPAIPSLGEGTYPSEGGDPEEELQE